MGRERGERDYSREREATEESDEREEKVKKE
jgi:hypothetical protein